MQAYLSRVVVGALWVSLAWVPGCTDQPFTVDVPIRVVGIHPSGIGVSRDAAVEAVFSEDLVVATVIDGANFYLEDINDPGNPLRVNGSIAYDQQNFKASFTPSGLLAYSTPYRVTLTTGILRLRDRGPLPVRVTGTFRTQDPPPLRLLGSSPGSDSIGVPLGSDMVLVFSEPVNCASVEAGVTVVEVFDPHPHTGPGQREVAGSWACSEPAPDCMAADTCKSCEGNDFCVVTFTPSEPFKYSSDATVTLKGGTRADGAVESFRATDFGGQLPEDLVFGFHLEDPPEFYLFAALPGPGMEGVELGTDIQLVFSEPVDCETLTGNLSVEETLDGHPRFGAAAGTTRQVTGTVTCNPATVGEYLCADGSAADPCVVTFDPDLPFERSSRVRIRLSGLNYTPGQAPAARAVESTRATSYRGNLTDEVVWSFQIKDPAPLAASSVHPAAGAEMVDRDLVLSFVFSEALNCASVNDLTVVVTETLDPVLGGGSSAVAGILTCTDGSPTVTFDPAAALNYSSQVNVVLKGGPFNPGSYPNHAVESAAATTRGGQLPFDSAYGFIALDPPPLYVVGTSPAAGSIRVATDANLEITFSEPADCSTVTSTSFTVRELTDTGASIAHTGIIICNAGNPVVVFDPNLDFQLTSQVTVSLDGSLRSSRGTSRGGTLGSDFSFTFSTADPQPLLVVSTAPGGFQDNVLLDANLVVTFSQAVNRSSVNPATFVVEDISNPGNPLPIACGVPDGTYQFSSGDAVVICDPPANFGYDATIRVRLTTGIRSAIATSGGGSLPFEVAWTFEVIPVPPIEVVQIVPRDGAQSVPVATTVAVTFNQDILQSTLITYQDQRPCVANQECPGLVTCNLGTGTCNPDPANITVWLNPGSTSNIGSRVALNLIDYDANTFTAVFGPVVNLTAGLQYTFTVRGGLSGVRGRYGASILVADFTSNFTTGINQLLAKTIPNDGATGVSVTTEVCVVFLEDIDPATITTGSFALSFTDGFGTHAVPVSGFTFEGVHPTTLEPDTTGTYNNNLVCLVIAPEFWDCHPDARPLLYQTAYQATLTDAITNASGSVNLVGGYAWVFATAGPPQVAGAYGKNPVVTVDPLHGAADVPVNSSFHVVFAKELNPATVDSTRLQILNDAGAPMAAAVSTSPDGKEAVITPNPVLNYDATYSLSLSGGYLGVWMADGSYLDADFVARFTTSPPTYAFISPPQGDPTYSTAMTPLVFSREVHFPSLTEINIYAVDNTDGVTLQGVVATNTGDPDSAILQVVPTFEGGHNVTVLVTTRVQDFRGNPLAQQAQVNYPSVGNTPAVNARIPDLIAAANLTPPAGSSVLGDQAFVMTMPGVGGNLKDRMLPPTFNRYTIGFVGTGGAAGCTNEPFGTTNQFTIGAAGLPDSVTIRANRKLRSGCGYRLVLRQAEFANIYAVSNGGADVVIDYTGESLAPTLAVADIHLDAMGGADVPANGRIDVWPHTAVWATFSENLDPPSVMAATFTMVCDGSPVAGNISVGGRTATFMPLLRLPGGAACTVTLTGAVTDLAGNPLGSNVSASFTVESTPPAVVASDPADGAVNVAQSAVITLTFSEAVDPATLTASTTAGTGTIRLWDRDRAAEVLGCILPGVGPAEIIFSPFRDLQPATNYDILVTTGVTDWGGTPLAADFTASFTTQ